MALVTVIGAAGRQGIAQMRQLLKAGYEVRAISRNPDTFQGTEFENVEVRSADIFDLATLPDALEGSDAVFYTHPFVDMHGRSETIGQIGHAAKEVGVRRVVWNMSSWVPDRPGDPGMYQSNTDGMNALWRSGVNGTVFGSVLFMDNLLTNWARPSIVNEDRFVYSHRPDLEANWISLDDVAKFMIASLGRDDLVGRCFNIGGPERLTPVMVAQSLSRALNKQITYSPISPADFGRRLVSAFDRGQMTPEEAEVQAKGVEAFYEYNNNAPTRPFEVNIEHLLDCIPIEMENFEQWARRQDWSDNANVERPSGG